MPSETQLYGSKRSPIQPIMECLVWKSQGQIDALPSYACNRFVLISLYIVLLYDSNKRFPHEAFHKIPESSILMYIISFGFI
jgi:hypothetical protein